MTFHGGAINLSSALLGGGLIGVAVSIFVLVNGRIAGISGIVGGLLKPVRGDVAWRAAFILGLMAAPTAYKLFSALPKAEIDGSYGTVIAAGILVGFGTRYGSGCTSGHGVCGLSRGSRRSFLATIVFMSAAIVTVYVTRHLTL